MSTFLDRLKVEEGELLEKLEKLSEFIYSEGFDNLDEENKSLLLMQVNTMGAYHEILIRRITINDK